MQQYPQVVSVNSVIAANLILVPFLQKNLPQQSPVAFWKQLQDISNLLLGFPGRQLRHDINFARARLLLGRILIHRAITRAGSIMLQKHVVADRVHERSQAFGMENLPVTQRRIKSDKRLLAHILNGFFGLQA